MSKIMKFFSQFKMKGGFRKKHLAFFTVIPLLTMLAVVKAPCPICDGTGKISTTGMGEVKIIAVDSTLQSVGTVEGCVNYMIYTYNVALTLQNNSKVNEANGYILLALVDYTTSKVLSTRFHLVTVPVSMQLQTIFPTVFMIGMDSPKTTNVTARIVLNDVACDACGGTGRVAVNQLPLLTNMKKTFTDVQRVQAIPVVQVPLDGPLPEEWMGQEYSTDQWILQFPEGQYPEDATW
jgi:hypothetical protein